MAELSHTPGPWKTEPVMDELATDICLDYRIPGAGDPICIAFAHGPDEDDEPGSITKEQAIANAKLMAAAPELLRELIDFHAHAIDQGFHDCEALDGECPVQQAIDKAIGDHGSNNNDEHEHEHGGEA